VGRLKPRQVVETKHVTDVCVDHARVADYGDPPPHVLCDERVERVQNTLTENLQDHRPIPLSRRRHIHEVFAISRLKGQMKPPIPPVLLA
jgi:hypothetical protein